MLTLTYMPFAHDNDETVVGGIKFRAYEPVDMPDTHTDLAERLKTNRWFSEGEIDADRKSAWQKDRDARAELEKSGVLGAVAPVDHAAADAHLAAAKKAAEDIEAKARVAADSYVAAARAEAERHRTEAMKHAAAIVADAHVEAAKIVANAEPEDAAGMKIKADVLAKAQAEKKAADKAAAERRDPAFRDDLSHDEV
jgi:hypothetical protein